MLFVIGGDGTLRGAPADRRRGASARGCQIAVVGVPKTIDNDIMYIDQSFGFQTAFAARPPSRSRRAHIEASSSPERRRPGQADGPALRLHRLLRGAGQPRRRLRADPRGAVPAGGRPRVAGRSCGDGSSSRGMPSSSWPRGPARTCRLRRRAVDASGNARLADIGALLRQRITAHFAAAGVELNLQVHRPQLRDPQRARQRATTRLLPAAGATAVHAAMAGRTEMVVGRWHGRFVHVPMALATGEPQPGRPGRRPVDVGPGGDRPAGTACASGRGDRQAGQGGRGPWRSLPAGGRRCRR